MSRAFPQLEMQPLYGLSHYLVNVVYGMFFRGEVVGLDHLPARGGFLIAANHVSFLDPPFITCLVPRQIATFARKTLWKGGLVSWWFEGVGTIPVDRDGGQDVSAIKRVLKTLADERGLILFPEGTRSLDGRLQKAKGGVGFIASRTQVPVVPVRIFGAFEAFGKNQKVPRLGTRVSVVFGEPMLPADYDEPEAGKERNQIVSERIMARIAALRPPPVTVI